MPKFKGFSKYAYKPRKPGYHLHNFLNTGTFNSKAKVWFLGLAILIMLVGGFFLYQTPLINGLFHTEHDDPALLLWQDSSPSNDLSEFNTLLASYSTLVRDGITYRNIKLDANSTTTAIAISKNPVDFSIISSRTLYSLFNFATGTPCCGTAGNTNWGIFLTTNKTIPRTQSYEPFNDRSISLLIKIFPNGGAGGSFLMQEYFQRIIGESLSTGNANGCNSGGTCFLQTTYTRDPTLHEIAPQFIVNYTGVSNGAACTGFTGNGCSSLLEGFTATFTSTQSQPWFSFQAQSYYVGFYALGGTNYAPMPIYWAFDGGNTNAINCAGLSPACMEFVLYQPVIPPNAPAQPPTPDTGGFFGPVIKALIGLGIFIINSIMNFVAFVEPAFKIAEQFLGNLATIILSAISSVIIAVLNGLGSLIGDPNLGNQLVTLFTSIGSFISSLLAGIGSLISTIITFIQDVLTFFFDATNGLITYWLGTIIFGIFGVLVTISNIIVTVLKLFQVGFPFIVLLDILWLLMESYDNGTDGALKWWTPHEILIVNVGKLIIFLIQQLSEFTYQTIIAIEGGAADIKPEVAGFSP